MKFLGYIIVYSKLWLIARLPKKIIYSISDLLYLFIYYVARYRRDVVYGNLRKVFPDYNEKEIKSIAKKFYKHLSDVIIESAIIHFIPFEKSCKQFTVKNPEIVNQLKDKKKNIVAISGHYGNWEFLSHLEKHIDHQFVAIYKPLKNKYFDRFIRKSRSKYGSILVPMNKIARTLIKLQKDNILSLSGFLADQRPIWEHIQHWTKFMGLDTPVYMGPEKIARKLNSAVVFMGIRKIKRGFYEIEFTLITENALDEEPFTVTETYFKLMEELIRENPAYWLWSHDRWKFNFNDFKDNHPNYTDFSNRT
ncbi:MAG TPA: lipid A biosynthesis acyltransferase [Candidatus Marinimicrobia bacterium]|nr:lipid A biosynthesis acyltransferase [Candidatus Neomarinimicrobiota bacterium]